VRAVTISKQYVQGEGGYWYAYHSDWDRFLSEASQGLYVLGCIGETRRMRCLSSGYTRE